MQKKTSEETEKTILSIAKAAHIANVSEITIRNWIKTGYLTEKTKGVISHESFNSFMQNIAGKEKLNSRANKLKKDEHNHIKLSSEIFKKLAKKDINTDKLGEEYQSSLSNSYRNKEGVYYTPQRIIVDMLKDIKTTSSTTFCDPSCGSGNFILEAINLGLKPENVYGYDVDANAVAITKKRIFVKTGYHSENIICADFLELAALPNNKLKFDLIFTNPPWGKKINKNEKERFGEIFNSGKSLDTSSLFFFASIKILKKEGILGFLLPEAFFNIASFQEAREVALQYKIKRFIDYGKAFKGLLTKAQAIILQKKLCDENDEICCQINNKPFKRNLISFKNNPKKIFNFWINKQEEEVIKHIYNLPHISLKNNAKWALGIVTGNNSKYCLNEHKKGYVPVFKGSDIKPNELKKPTNYIPTDFSIYQQVAPLELYKAPVKLIYKFISSNLAFYCDTEQRFILNSANLFIPDKNTGISKKQLSDILNSNFMNWLFKSIFNTHKVLRSDLEALPIHVKYFDTYKVFDEKTYLNFLQIIKTNNGTYRVKKS
ncbi:MAG: N-6 DNA methylase [Bacteroidales bacterium]|nr:N-6 DNA methylase [Bacteroidales bacterium]